MSALPAFKEPDPLNPYQVMQTVMAILAANDETLEAYGFDQIEWANGGFSALAEYRRKVCVAIMDPNSQEAADLRDLLTQKWARMAEDAEWPAS